MKIFSTNRLANFFRKPKPEPTWKRLWKTIGPGFITGAADDDPSGIGTYSQTGAQFGFSQLWTSPFSLPFMTTIQEMCGRIGMVTGKGLAKNISQNYSYTITYIAVMLLVTANTINIGANLGAMAASAQLLAGSGSHFYQNFSFWIWTMTVTTLLLEVFVSYKVYARVLKYFAFALLAYVLTFFVVKPDLWAIFYATVLPHVSFTREYIFNFTAILGTTISPYLFFWQANEEIEEEVVSGKLRQMGHGTPQIEDRDIKEMRIDTFFGMFSSNIVMFFIIATTASVLFANGIHSIDSAADAAKALEPLAGPFAGLLFAAGIIGTGLLAVPVLAGSAAYALSEAFGWREGLYMKFKKAHGFYGVITLATLAGLLINFVGVNPIKALYYTAIVNGVLAPPLMVLIMLISNNKKIMGDHINGSVSNWLGWTITVIMGASALGTIYALVG